MTITKVNRKAVVVPVQQLPHAEGLPLPVYQTAGSAGLDLTAALPERKPVRIPAGARVLIPTGLVAALPRGYEAQVRPRSGLALKQGLTVLNSPGTIDSDYRGEVQVILVNLSREAAVIRRGDRIAQMVIAPVTQARLTISAKLTATARGDGGFGSTGKVASAPAGRPKRAPKPKVAASVSSGRSVKKSNEVAPARPAGKSVPKRARSKASRTR